MANRRANTDRISHLPSEIIEKILNLLPCRDAVRTSILSSDWRGKWMSMTDLNFGAVYPPTPSWTRFGNQVNFINQFLIRHQGPIRKFSVAVHTSRIKHPTDQWIKLVSERDIQQLQIDAGYYTFESSSCLFNCKKLTHLELIQCSLHVPPPTFEGFMNLKVLNLSRIKVKHKRSIESLISKSPLLESLSLYISNDLYSKILKITISAPKVKYLSLRGNLKYFCLKNSPALVDMILYLWGFPRDCDLIKILGGAPNLEKLTVEYFQNERSHSLANKDDSYFWQKEKEYLVGHCYMKLKVVEMGNILCKGPDIEFAKFILSNSPNLEKMTIRTRERNQEKLTRMLEKLPTLSRASAQVVVTFMTVDGDQTVV